MDFYKIFSIALGLSQFIFGWLFWSLRREFVAQHTCNERKMCVYDELGKLKTRMQVAEHKTEEYKELAKNIQQLVLAVKDMGSEIKLNTKSTTKLEERVGYLEEKLYK